MHDDDGAIAGIVEYIVCYLARRCVRNSISGKYIIADDGDTELASDLDTLLITECRRGAKEYRSASCELFDLAVV